MVYYIDIDNTICKTNNSDYENSVPIYDRINHINKLFNIGHTIIYWTARGSTSGKDWSDLTKKQLDSWGCLYNSIVLDKPSYDLYIDDKSINSEVFFSKNEITNNR